MFSATRPLKWVFESDVFRHFATHFTALRPFPGDRGLPLGLALPRATGQVERGRGT